MAPEDTDGQIAEWVVLHADELLGQATDFLNDPLRLSKFLRKQIDASHAAELCSLRELRQRAKNKFARAERMFFTRIGYEQSSSQAVASYKARRFAGLSVVDLCCGIGGDAIALAEHANELTIVDRSARAVCYAQENVERHERKANGVIDDIRNIALNGFHAWHLDPDRRPDGRRKSSPNICEPPLDEFLETTDLPSHGAIKLSPAADVSHLLERGAELEWIECQHECRQQVAWLGKLAGHPGRKTATVILGHQNSECESIDQFGSAAGEVGDTAHVVQRPLDYIYEPKPAVLAADLVESLAEVLELSRLRGTVLLTSDSVRKSNLLRRFRVVDSLAYREKALLSRLVALGFRVTEVKKRGVDIDPNIVLKKLSKATAGGKSDCLLFLLPNQRSTHCLIAQRDDVSNTE